MGAEVSAEFRGFCVTCPWTTEWYRRRKSIEADVRRHSQENQHRAKMERRNPPEFSCLYAIWENGTMLQDGNHWA